MKEIIIKETESKLGLKFVETSPRLLNELNGNIKLLSEMLGKRVPLPNPPSYGFLETPLTSEQSKKIEGLFGENYAELAVNLQDKLAESVVIEELGEKMVSLPMLFQSKDIPLSLSTTPFNEASGKWAGKERVFWTRQSVSEKVLKAAEALQHLEFMLHIEDCFRPMGVQEGLFSRRIKLLLEEHPDWVQDWKKVWAEARSKTAFSPFMAGHKSGAAIDITIRRLDGTPLPLGNKYPEGGAKVALRFPFVTQEEWSTRQLFSLTMEMSGLRVYPYENWHASFGDLSAGIAAFSDIDVTTNYHGNYGPIKDFDPKTGEIVPYNRDEYFKPFYSEDELMKKYNTRETV